jgi:hypothetical protein
MVGAGEYGPDKCALQRDRAGRMLPSPRTQVMKRVLIASGLLATTGIVYAACIFC